MRRIRGFSLVEMAIVLALIALLLGGLMLPLSQRQEQARRGATRDQLQAISDALVGFVVANGRLPCPASHTSNGRESGSPGACTHLHGFIPATTLGLTGARNSDGLLLDPWHHPYRYSVSKLPAFTTTDALTLATAGTLRVCSTASVSASACSVANTAVADDIGALVLSIGKSDLTPTSADELENAGPVALGGYVVANDEVFVDHAYSETAGAEFDDLATWIAASTLKGKLVAAGRLP